MEENQIKLFDIETEHEEEWKEMPEYINHDLKPWNQLIINFENRQDFDKFCKLIGQKMTKQTISTWYPSVDKIFVHNKRYGNES